MLMDRKDQILIWKIDVTNLVSFSSSLIINGQASLAVHKSQSSSNIKVNFSAHREEEWFYLSLSLPPSQSLSHFFSIYLINFWWRRENKRRQVAAGIRRRISVERRKRRRRRRSIGDGSIRGGKRGSDSEEGRWNRWSDAFPSSVANRSAQRSTRSHLPLGFR